MFGTLVAYDDDGDEILVLVNRPCDERAKAQARDLLNNAQYVHKVTMFISDIEQWSISVLDNLAFAEEFVV